MKKLISVAVAVVICLNFVGTAFAIGPTLTVNPVANQPVYDNWYKDSITIPIEYTCADGAAYNYNYSPGLDGIWSYLFMQDQYGNLWLYTSSQGNAYSPSYPQELTTNCSVGISTGGNYPQNPINMTQTQPDPIYLDAEPPAVSITSPSGNIDSSSSSYSVSGTATDQESGVKSVQLFINGQAGPSASLSGGTWNANISLGQGTNSIQAIAYDFVGHEAKSNTIDITYGTESGGGTSGGSTQSSSSSSGSKATTTPTKTSSTNTAPLTSQTNNILFGNNGLISINNNSDQNAPSNPNVVLAESGFPSVSSSVYFGMVAVIILLLLATGFVIWRFRPVFLRLDRSNSGLRRKVILIVTLPSLLPLFGLGFLAYQQLSHSLKSSLSQELARAAETASIKLSREFAIRQNIITISGNDVLQINNQYKNNFSTLASQDSACLSLIKSAIPSGRYSSIVSNPNCLPFLASIAQVTNTSPSNLAAFEQALTAGYNNSLASMKADEAERINSYLANIREVFPETTELYVLGQNAYAVASLPPINNLNPISQDFPYLLKSLSSKPAMLFDSRQHDLIVTYPINSGSQNNMGDAVVAFNINTNSFIPAIWQTTPKPYVQDQVYFIDSAGQQIFPDKRALSPSLVKKLFSTDAGTLAEITLSNRRSMAFRVSAVSGTDWSVAVGAPPSTILAPIAGIQRVALLAIAGFLLLSLLLGIFFVSSIATEIQALFDGALKFAKGELDFRIGLKTHDELKVLAETMNSMASDIKTAQSALIEKDREFISIATHELKAPMTAIIGNLSMITEDHMGQVDQTAQKLIDQAYNGTVRLRNLVSDMLDVARLESGRAEFKLEAVDLGLVVNQIIESQEIIAQEANITITYKGLENLPKVTADKGKLEIIMTNFISNAIKYNHNGGSVTVSHEIIDNRLITSVSDTGLGIPDDQKEHIFEKFYRVKHEDRANVPGTGLGMYITKRFVEAMNGSIWFDSVHGQGTTFYFSLPIALNQSTSVKQQQTMTPTNTLSNQSGNAIAV
jgi:signal transduction histidine kinase